ncbi:MAG: tyrosine-type recombinase/integrase [Alphaproteobacteria bacterium]|nr:tyrosine-type recombinase/integrase [Alphaproteobacteria bacterium]
MAPRRKWLLEHTRVVSDRKGRPTYAYVRNPVHPAHGVRLKGKIVINTDGTARPDAAMTTHYDTLMAEPVPTRPDAKAFAGLVADYLASPEFSGLKDKTRKDYGNLLARLVKRYGTLPYAAVDREVVYKIRDSYADKPRMANYFVQVLRLLFAWAVERKRMAGNPATKIKALKTGARRDLWSPEAEAKFLAAADGPMTLAYMLAVFTAQRQADVLAMSWSSYDGKRIAVRQQKTGALVAVPCHPELKRALDSINRTATTILTTSQGRPFKSDHFRHEWRAVTLAAGLDGLQFRDLRRTAAVRLSEAGATTQEVAAVTGHDIEATQSILDTYIPRSQAMADEAIRKLVAMTDKNVS